MCSLFKHLMLENLAKHGSYESSLVYSYDCLHTCQRGLLYLSFPMTVSFYHKEHSFNLYPKV